jgi:geranylgeranyl pyrophosphate synthase
MRDDIEKAINKYFPSKWKKEDLLFFLGKSVYELDSLALDRNLNKPIRDFVLRGGKRLRPVLFLTCIEAFGEDYKKYIDFALLIELVHNGTLILDDVEDDGVLRRGKQTCHRRFGIDTAVNAGFALHVLPLRLLIKHNRLSNTQRLRLWNSYSEELINLSFGQGLDIYWHKNPERKIGKKRYLEMVRLKTGSLMRMSLRMACIIGNKSVEIENLFKNFGESLGIAFQVVDDCLDLSADRKKFGKTYGNDITEGKISLPVVFTLENASVEERERLIEILGKHTREKRLIREAISIIKQSGSLEQSFKYARNIVDDAWKKLNQEKCKDINCDKLKEIAYFFVKRDY